MINLALLIFLSPCLPAWAAAPAERSGDQVLQAMAEAGGTAAQAAEYLLASGVAVEFDESISEVRSRRTWKRNPEGGEMIRVILLNPRYAGEPDKRPALAASVIASDAAELIYANMPESAEKRYIAIAFAAQTFLELGGDSAALSEQDPQWAEAITFWMGHTPKKGVKQIQARGANSLSELRRSAEDSLDSLRRSNGEAVLLGALSGRRGQLGWGMRRSYLKQMIESSKARLKSIDAAGKDFKAFKKYDKAWRRSAD